MPSIVKPRPARRVRGVHGRVRRPVVLRRPEPRITSRTPGDARTIRNALVIICLGALMSAIDATVTNVALDTLERDLHSSVADVQWVMTAYLLSIAGVIPVSGWASRRFGARRVYVWSLALFGASSGLCALAGSLGMLIGARLLQGVAGGMLVPIGQLIAAEVAGPGRMGKMVSRIWMFSSVGSMAGPTLGGALLQGLGWRWIFLVNVPISAVATVAAVYLLPHTPSRPAGRLDLGGLARLSLGVPATIFALAQAQASGSLLSPRALVPMAVGLILVGDFVRHALRCPRPLLDLRLWTRRTFRSGLVAIFFVDLVWFGVLVLLPLSFQQLRHATPLAAGLLMAPQGLGTAIGMWVCGRLADGPLARRLGAAGALALACTTMVVAGFGSHMAAAPICLTLLVAGFAAGVSWVPATAVSYAGLAGDEISHASPLVTVVMRLGASFGTAIAAIVLQAQLGGGHVLARRAGAGHVLAAYGFAFHLEAAVALFAALVYVWMCRVVHRSPPPARLDTAELVLASA